MGGIISFSFINDGSVCPLLKGVIRETKDLENSYICYCGRYADTSKSFHTETFPNSTTESCFFIIDNHSYSQQSFPNAVSRNCVLCYIVLTSYI